MAFITALATALAGAAVGGTISKATGGSFWKGALMGSVTGGVGSGVARATGMLGEDDKASGDTSARTLISQTIIPKSADAPEATASRIQEGTSAKIKRTLSSLKLPSSQVVNTAGSITGINIPI